MMEDMIPGKDMCISCEKNVCDERFHERDYNEVEHCRYDIYYCSEACMKKQANRHEQYAYFMKSKANMSMTRSEYFEMAQKNINIGNYGNYMFEFIYGTPCIVQNIYDDMKTGDQYVLVTKPRFYDGDKYHFELSFEMDNKLIQWNTTRICVTLQEGVLRGIKIDNLVVKKGKVVKVINSFDTMREGIVRTLWT